MIKVGIKATVEEVLFKGEKSCVFLISNGENKLAATITAGRMDLFKKIQVGRKYNFEGNIRAYVKQRTQFTENIFYVMAIN